VFRRNERGSTALMCALRSKAADATLVPRVVQALLDADADVAARDHDGNTPLHWLATRAMQPWAGAVARLLLASGASGRQENEEGATPADCVPDDEDDDEEGGGARDGELYALLLQAEQA